MTKNFFKNKFGRDILITTISQLVILIMAFSLNKILSLKLDMSGYGTYSIVKRTAGLVTYVMVAGMGIAIPRYLAMYREKKDATNESRYIISSIILMSIYSLIIILISLVIKNYLSKFLFGNESYNIYIIPILLYAYSSALTTFVYSYYRGIDKFYMYSISQIMIQIITLILALIWGSNLVRLIYSWGIITGTYGLYMCIKIWRKYYKAASVKNYKDDLKPYILELISFCTPRIVGEFILFSYTLIPLIIINNRLSMEVAGYFSAATSINSMITPVFSFIGVILLPVVSKSIAGNKLEDAEDKINMLFKLYFIIGIICILFIQIFPEFIINLLFTQEYQEAIPSIRIMILSILPNSFYLLLRNPIDAASKKPYNTVNLIISFIILILLVSFSNNIMQYSIAFLVAYTLLGILSLMSWKKCKLDVKNICSPIVD